MPDDAAALRSRLDHVRETIARAACAVGRAPEAITLVAVSKTHSQAAVQQALACGQWVFGENRVQEATGKFLALRPAHPALRLHILGPLQTNKVRDALAIADLIETLDRPRLADALEAALAPARARGETLPQLLVQVNVGEEPQKAGIAPGEADAFIRDCQRRFGQQLAGLMCIPPVEGDPARHFDWLADRAARHGLPIVSMGMSGDYETAVRHGATHVRVGTAIFGNRPST